MGFLISSARDVGACLLSLAVGVDNITGSGLTLVLLSVGQLWCDSLQGNALVLRVEGWVSWALFFLGCGIVSRILD